MAESIIIIACIHEVSPSILSSILSKAYDEARKIKSPPTLVLHANADEASLRDCVFESVTYPLISESFVSPFLGWSIHDVARYLKDNAGGSIVDSTLFLVADEKTSEDGNTLVLVKVQTSDQHTDELDFKSVRLAAEFANTSSVAVSVGSTSIEEMLSLIVSKDEVYRAGRDRPGWRPPQKGGPAPRKQF